MEQSPASDLPADNQKLAELEARMIGMERRMKGLEAQNSELWICLGGLLALVMLGIRLMHEATPMRDLHFIINIILTALFGMLVGLVAARWQRYKTK